MSEATFASLGPTLLARKGGAKPAMRPQLAPLPEQFAPDTIAEEALEDLGWNDMGSDDAGENANVVALTPSALAEQSGSPVIKRQQKDLAERVLADAAMDIPAVSKPKNTVGAKDTRGRRAAFTLRLDTDRHLKLRLAATMKGVSAQALVTEALDSLLDRIEDLNALAERMKRN